MPEIFNCWQCKYYSDKRCNKMSNTTALPDDPICGLFKIRESCKKHGIHNCGQCYHYDRISSLCMEHGVSCAAINPICEDFSEIHKPEKKRALASSRVQLIAKEIEWLRLDPQMHDQMFYDALLTCEQMLRHIAASVKNSEQDFYLDTVEVEKHG